MGTKTFLSYVNDLLVPYNEVQVSSSDWASLHGPQLMAKNSILRAVDLIQMKERKWPFNRTAGSQVLTIGTVEYTWPSDLRDVDMNSFYIEKDDTLDVDTTPLEQISTEDWYKYHRKDDYDNATAGRGLPSFVFRSSGKFGITQCPDDEYTVKYTYFNVPTRMSAYTDTTTIPDEYQQVVIDQAMVFMNKFYENDQQVAQAEKEAKESLGAMRSILINDDFRMQDTRVPR